MSIVRHADRLATWPRRSVTHRTDIHSGTIAWRTTWEHRLCDLRDVLRLETGVNSSLPVAAVSWIPGGWDGHRTGGPMSTSHMLQAYPRVLPAPRTGGRAAGPCSAGYRAMRDPDEVWSREEDIYHLVLLVGD